MSVVTDENGLNIKINSHVLNDKRMREIGFTDNRAGYWYYCKMVPFGKEEKYNGVEISFNVSIPKDGSRPRIDVLDDDFCQPYDYQMMLEDGNRFEPAVIVRDFVEDQMEYLQNTGVLSGHIRGEYI